MKSIHDFIFVIGTITIMVYIIIRYIFEHNNKVEKETLDYNEMEEEFFNKISEENRPYKLLNIYFPIDLMMIESLLISVQIPYYIDFKYFMGVRPFVKTINYNNANLYILENDYNDAIILLQDYLKSKTLENYKLNEKIRSIIEILMIFWIIPSAQNTLGIDIYYKENRNEK
jgi:hypothetical protein